MALRNWTDELLLSLTFRQLAELRPEMELGVFLGLTGLDTPVPEASPPPCMMIRLSTVPTFDRQIPQKIQAIRMVRALTDMGLKDAKDCVDNLDRMGPQIFTVPEPMGRLFLRLRTPLIGYTFEEAPDTALPF